MLFLNQDAQQQLIELNEQSQWTTSTSECPSIVFYGVTYVEPGRDNPHTEPEAWFEAYKKIGEV